MVDVQGDVTKSELLPSKTDVRTATFVWLFYTKSTSVNWMKGTDKRQTHLHATLIDQYMMCMVLKENG